ncbi:MAG TPA: hypothetical protein VMY39_02900 [Planctomycetota bacterium]|nr:hypothetical protein [Planctomycetota bacterium]HUV38529.1 hypothetical protein [Planctomycetota bacterium]
MKRTLILSAALVLVAAVALAQDDERWKTEIEQKLAKRVAVNFQDQTLNAVLEYFRRVGKLNIILDSKSAPLGERKFTLSLMTEVKIESGIAWTARLMGLEYAVRDEAIYLASRDHMPVDWRSEMQERYRSMVATGQEGWVAGIDGKLEQKIKVDFKNDDLARVLQFLGTVGQLNIVLDYHLADRVKPIKLEGEYTIRSVLNWVMRLGQIRDETGKETETLKYVIRDEVIYVADTTRLEQLRLATGESVLGMTFRRPVTYHFTRTDLREAVDRLSRLSNVKIRLDGLRDDEKILVTLSGEGVELNRAVRNVMNETRRPYAISFTGTTIVIMVSPKRDTPKTE